jgi:glycosyltransferase involved in cell wall biosynthesis
MRVLFLTTRLPHARVIGAHAIVYHRIRLLLERGHEVGLACFASPEQAADEGREWPGRLVDFRTLPDPSPAGPFRQAVRGGLHGVPPPFSLRTAPGMRELVGDMVARDRYAIVLAEFTAMGQYIHGNPYLPAARIVVSCHECAAVASQTRIDFYGYRLRGLTERVRRRFLRAYEFGLYRAADCVFVLTPQERYQLLGYAPDLRTAVIPSGVDTRYFAPPAAAVARDGIVFTGYYSHEPNRDAVMWFARQVWPSVRMGRKGLKLFIVGPDPSSDIADLARGDPDVAVTGEVADVRPYLHRAAAFVCPVRMGSGMRGKILEAMACEAPVVSTSLGAEGIPAQSGQNCLLGDDAQVMARQINLLLDDDPLRRKIVANARRLATERFSWDQIGDLLEASLNDVLTRRL